MNEVIDNDFSELNKKISGLLEEYEKNDKEVYDTCFVKELSFPEDIVDERKSVAWNKKEIKLRNKQMSDDIDKSNKERQKRKEEILNEIFSLYYEVFGIEKRIIKRLFFYTRSSIYDYICEIRRSRGRLVLKPSLIERTNSHVMEILRILTSKDADS